MFCLSFKKVYFMTQIFKFKYFSTNDTKFTLDFFVFMSKPGNWCTPPHIHGTISSNFIINPPSISLKIISAEIYHNYISLLNIVEKFSEFSICVLWENDSKRNPKKSAFGISWFFRFLFIITNRWYNRFLLSVLHFLCPNARFSSAF